jgi:lysophospholipase L1-like esterase
LFLLLLVAIMPSRLRPEWGPYIPADHPALRWEGRVRIDAEHAATYDWTSVRLHLAFQGRALAVFAHLGQNYLDVIVDGQRVAVLGRKPKTEGAAWADLWVAPSVSGGKPVFVVQGLSAGEHQVVLAKRTSPNFGPMSLEGLRLEKDATLLKAPAAPKRRLEFVGDSLTNGYGNEGVALQCAELAPFENSSLSWARQTAEALGADAQMLAFSGYGLVRNYGAAGQSSPDPVPLFYPRTVLAEAGGLWDRSRFVPDATVVFLGSNDHSTAPAPEAETFIRAYHAFLGVLRQGRPGLPILCAYPDNDSDFAKRVQQVVAEEKAKGLPVEALGLPPAKDHEMGCDYHPLVVVHERWRDLAVEKLRKILSW